MCPGLQLHAHHITGSGNYKMNNQGEAPLTGPRWNWVLAMTSSRPKTTAESSCRTISKGIRGLRGWKAEHLNGPW